MFKNRLVQVVSSDDFVKTELMEFPDPEKR